jgi:hypothetical protein
MAINFELRPEEIIHTLVKLEQKIGIYNQKGCKETNPIRLEHRLFIENHSDIKQRIFVKWFMDTQSAFICGDGDPIKCTGGTDKKEIKLHIKQPYWAGIKKNIITFFCWQPKENDVDFNIQIEITSTVFSCAYSPQELKDMNLNVLFVAYVSALKEAKE